MRIAELLPARAAAAIGRQLVLAKAIPESEDWDMDVQHGELAFKDGPTWKVEVLGTVNESSDTWVWAWGDDRLPDDVVREAKSLERYGLAVDLEEFTEEDFKLGGLRPDDVALMCTAVLPDAAGFYRCSFPGGGVYMLVVDENAPREVPDTHAMVTAITAAIETLGATYEHKALIEGYAWGEQLSIDWQDTHELILEGEDGSVICNFDEQMRLTNLEATDQPGEPCNLRSLVKNREEAEACVKAGYLDRVFLMPLELGGLEVDENITYVPPACALEKSDFDATVAEAAQKGLVSSYSATPQYEDENFLPTTIELETEGPRPLDHVIDTLPFLPVIETSDDDG